MNFLIEIKEKNSLHFTVIFLLIPQVNPVNSVFHRSFKKNKAIYQMVNGFIID
jgi:hypothetical protein